jgi:hypothetical protein
MSIPLEQRVEKLEEAVNLLVRALLEENPKE